jgi:DNA polymerase III alpha subunit
MNQNKFGELIHNEQDLCDLLMQGHDLASLQQVIVDQTVKLEQWPDFIDPVPDFHQQKFHTCSVPGFHAQRQNQWRMPDAYKELDIAAHVLNLCESEAELQRCGAELMLYQERNLFDLLRYLKYLVDVMRDNNIVWGVGRGSSVASYVLYKLAVHRVDSLYYNLDIEEFLR